METNEASPASETSLAAIVKTEEENSKISGRNYLCWIEVVGSDQRVAKQWRPGNCTNPTHPELPGVAFLGTSTFVAQS